MHAPVEIHFRGITRSNELAHEIQDRVNELESKVERIDRCRVLLEAVESESFQDNNYRVQIQMSVPHHELFVGQEVDDHHQYDDPVIAIDQAFELLRDQLRDCAPDHHAETGCRRGVIAQISLPEGPENPQNGRGVISTCDGQEFCFHAEDLVDIEFQRLELGSRVEFVERAGADGPIAVSIRLVGEPQLFLI